LVKAKSGTLVLSQLKYLVLLNQSRSLGVRALIRNTRSVVWSLVKTFGDKYTTVPLLHYANEFFHWLE